MPKRFMYHVWTKLIKTLIVFLHQIKNQRFKHRKQFYFVERKKNTIVHIDGGYSYIYTTIGLN